MNDSKNQLLPEGVTQPGPGDVSTSEHAGTEETTTPSEIKEVTQ